MSVVTYEMKSLFFDRPAVETAVARGERKALSRIGAFLRTRARTSTLRRVAFKGKRANVRRIRDGKASKVQESAKAGEPPRVRSRDRIATIRNILFAFQPETHSVVTGPVALNTRLTGGSETTVPGLLERGGSVNVAQWKPAGSSVWSMGNVRKPGVQNRMTRAQYAAHPFMGPTLEAEIAAGTIPAAYAGVVTG